MLTSGKDNTDTRTGTNEGSGEDKVVLLSDDGISLLNDISVLRNSLGLTSESRLFNFKRGGLDFKESHIGRDLVTLRDLNDISRNEFS